MLDQKETDIAAALESLVVISAPCSALPDRCTRRKISISASLYRPVVEVHDTAERLYSKNGLPLFEILDDTDTCDNVDINNEGPAAAVLRRRRQSRKNTVSDQPTTEDLSDAHYRQMHRKPEYLEKRVRNRELELYQYAQWREAQRQQQQRRLPVGAKQDVPKTAKHEENSECCEQEIKVEQRHKRARVGRSNELKGLVDSPGFVKAREKASAGSPPTSSSSAAAADGAQESKINGDTNAISVLSPAERRAAHLGGYVLEQLLVQAARLPVCKELVAESDLDSDPALDSDTEPSEHASVGCGDLEMAGGSSSACCCCPREFALPPRLYAHMMKQRGRD
ncbi:hypothetical protein FB645_001776 [Coemansia sp. IMI 203386]|nr:hypothetical protein FB645_001776 [Coemansia sp. IMI 203386]